MKILTLAFLAFISTTVTASECSLSSGPAQTRIEFLRQGETVNWFGNDYLCVEKEQKLAADIIRIPADTCKIIKQDGQNVMIYCLSY